MALPHPILDDRSYAELRDELIDRIPVYNPEWTDHNAADPGITLLELFAFLGETLLYRFNQIPEATKLEFLKLLQLPLRPATPSRALLSTSIADFSAPLIDIGAVAKAGKIEFETEVELRVLPISVIAVCKAETDDPDEATEGDLHDAFTAAISELGELDAGEEAVAYESTQVALDGAGDPVDFGLAADHMIWIAVLNESELEPDDAIEQLTEHADGARIINLGFVTDRAAPARADVAPCPGEDDDDPGVAMEWEASTGVLDDDDDTRPRYTRLRVIEDTTKGIDREGVLRLELPDDADELGTFTLSVPELAGSGDLPPVLDEESEAKVLFWIRGFRVRDEALGKLHLVTANATTVVQQRRARAEYLGLGTGQPGQTFSLVHAPVMPETVILQVEGPDGWTTWTEVDGFHASSESDAHYVLDAAAGTIRVGNGVQGAVPQIGQRVRVAAYAYGGGTAGNVAAGAIAKLSDFPRVTCTNPFSARSGADVEPIEKALDRMPGELRRRDRAVTRGDFEELAGMVPGVGRANCLPRYYPKGEHPPDALGVVRMGRTEAAGVVTVVVLPSEDARNPDAPVPDRILLADVCRCLDQRRLVTTEVYVIPPRYRSIAVSIGLHIKPGYGVEAVRRWVELVIRQYLAPLPPYGPTGEGWPLGRRVHGPELEAAVLQVEGVEFLEGEGLRVAALDEDGALAAITTGQTVHLAEDELPRLAAITVVQGEPLPLNESIAVPDTGTIAVPIPVIREEC